MNAESRQRSVLIDEVSRALSEWTVTAHAEEDSTLEERFGGDWRRAWVPAVQTRLRHLAQAVAMDRPEVFVDAVRWAEHAFRVQGGRTEDHRASLKSMGGVLLDRLPGALGSVTAEYVDAAIRLLEEDGPATYDASLNGESSHRGQVLRYLEKALSSDRRGANAVVIDEVEGGLSIEDAYLKILQPAQVEIGRLWHAGEISIGEEHAATAITESVMTTLRDRVHPKPAGRVIVATAVGGELHALGVRMVADFFEMAGWKTVYLGANTPAHDIVETLVAYEADVLAASCSSTLHLRTMGDLIRVVRSDDRVSSVAILAGGGPLNRIEGLWRSLGADGFASSARDAVRQAEQAMRDREGAA